MCCFGITNGSPSLHSRASIPARVITIIPTTYSSNPGTAAVPVIVDPYNHRAIAKVPHHVSVSQHASHHGGLRHHETPGLSLHRGGSRIHHGEVLGNLEGGHGYGGRFGRYR
ncbi:hypothetical protein EYC80_003380 [Monilinia laxa]|uniref:Uncharacterized protein n=1 Tax=Monilinia laxa TaxID=61186 RepID=A0A5N6KDI6_MONLA|nr:hypothetical protein EYC80_003380 [Monilinia laxa]